MEEEAEEEEDKEEEEEEGEEEEEEADGDGETVDRLLERASRMSDESSNDVRRMCTDAVTSLACSWV